ncbi:HD-GYP domain-containing protein [Paludibacterium paludis]|uniref:HD-GYP domain-containing protein n=1 Tax=Paludibacterium paludis TaxID=1225769 RepID=A0A918NYH3_9NEIS|nr:HD domain-containing phosphohydrolase [Paludibacterium paludis]GGY06314.1 hypothetical protein GCM10011289_05980 [Paludibacterium paludis]
MSQDDAPPLKTARIEASLLEVGRSLPVDVYARNGFLLLKRGHYVLTSEQKARLATLGYVEAPEEELPPPRVWTENGGERVYILDEMRYLLRRTRGLLHHPLAMPRFESAVRELADTLRHLARAQPDALIASIFLVPFGEYAPAHALHTASLLAVLTDTMSLPDNHRQTLIAAALTMNIAQVEEQNALFAQSDTLSHDQRESVRSHPLLGSAILREAGVQDEFWHTLVQTHHESWSGRGYPFGLSREAILPPAHLLHMADIACAKLTPRKYRAAMLPATALGQIYQRKDAEFDSAFTTLLIRRMGIYPPGSFVRLANGEIGVVIARGSKPNAPRVAALRKNDGPPYGEPLIRETRQSAYRIEEPSDAAAGGVRSGFLATLWRA